MKYKWEKTLIANLDFDSAREDIEGWLGEPDGVQPKIMGIIVANTEDGEACVVVNPHFDVEKDTAIADLWLDARSDAEAQRKKAMNYDN